MTSYKENYFIIELSEGSYLEDKNIYKKPFLLQGDGVQYFGRPNYDKLYDYIKPPDISSTISINYAAKFVIKEDLTTLQKFYPNARYRKLVLQFED